MPFLAPHTKSRVHIFHIFFYHENSKIVKTSFTQIYLAKIQTFDALFNAYVYYLAANGIPFMNQ